MRRLLELLLAMIVVLGPCLNAEQQEEEFIEEGLEESSEEYMREELGVNEITTPQIQKLLMDLDNFRPIPVKLLDGLDRQAVFSNRVQTAMHFGALVADGFVAVISERKSDIQDIGRALIRQARGLGVGESLTRRSKSLLELADASDWMGLRSELIKTQVEVEDTMMELRDEEMAHLVSFGGWLRGFQLAASATDENYGPQRAQGLARPEIMDYFIDRLETLHPRLKRTEFMVAMTSRMKTISALAAQAQGRTPTTSEVKEMRKLADEMVSVAFSKVNEEGRILDEQS